ncbi:cytochrome P450 3A24-like [Amblyomma americanum]
MVDWLPVTFVAIVFATLFIWRKRKFSVLKELGVPGPEPSLLFGNLLEIRRRGTAACFDDWIKKYGSVCGFYNGALPFLLVSDIDILKKVQIEDFHNFAQRGTVFNVEPLPDYRHKLIVTAPVSRWRELRAVLSPAFTTKKLSQIFVTMDECSDILIEKLEEKQATGQALELTSFLKRVTMDTMFRAGYGVDLKVQEDTAGTFFDELGAGAGKLLRSLPLYGVSFFGVCFPELYHLWYLISWLTSRIVTPYFKITTTLLGPVVSERKAKEMRQRVDVLQLLLNKENTGLLSTREGHAFDGKTKLTLDMDEVMANSAFYLIAGMEASPNTMGLALHLIARHPEIQDKLQAEISQVLKRDGKFTQKNVTEMTYLDMVLNESMRFYTGVVGFVSRQPEADYEVKGLKIPRGVSVMAAVSCLHKDPELWPEPEKFDPERFNPENKHLIHPASFQPFGKGPRECLGKNFALLEMKLILAKLLANFTFHVDEEHHKDIIELPSAFIASFVPSGIWMNLKKTPV